MPDLKSTLPWTSSPLIINAPMAGFAGGDLASAVTLAGGLGQVGCMFSVPDVRAQVELASSTLRSKPEFASSPTLPIGVGFLSLFTKPEDALPVVEEFKPAVVWLYAAATLDDYATWAEGVRRVSPSSQFWVQCGSVAAALHIARTARPDAICLQGVDAGGHGLEQGASIISLFPETADAFRKEGIDSVALLAAGGIVDGRGAAAAVALGAEGVVLGTKFLASHEVIVNETYQKALLVAKDGGQITARSKVYDELHAPNVWPAEWDGRSLAMQSYKDFVAGVDVEEIRRLHNEAIQKEDKGFAVSLEGRAAMWAGTGVGLIDKVEGAGDIVVSVREDAKKVLERVSKF